MDDIVDALDIQATGGQVGAYHHPAAAIAEPIDCLFAVALLHVAMIYTMAHALTLEKSSHTFGTLPIVDKDQTALVAQRTKQAQECVQLVLFWGFHNM